MADEAIAPKDGSSPEEKETPTTDTSVETLEVLTEKKEETVPLKKYMEEKRSSKEAEERAKALESELAKVKANMANMSVPAINDEITRLATEHNADPELLAKMMAMAKNVTAKEIRAELEQEYAPKFTKIEQEKALEQRDKKFDELFGKTLANMQEYSGIVNKEVIKALAFNPANAKKTLPQILEEAYGNAIQGRKTIESANSGSRTEEVDLTNPDANDFDKINADPALKKKWAEQAEAQIRQYL